MGMGYRLREILVIDDFIRTDVNVRAIRTKSAQADSLTLTDLLTEHQQTHHSIKNLVPFVSFVVKALLFANQFLRQLHRADRVFGCAVGFDLLRPVLCDRRAADHHFDARTKTFFI